mgnify:CR=1 FL=1
MSVEAFSGLLGQCDFGPTGKRWFPVLLKAGCFPAGHLTSVGSTLLQRDARVSPR